MAKRGRKLPPLTAADFKRVLRAAGWLREPGTKHLAYYHPQKPSKVNIDEKWKNVKTGSWVFRSVVHEQAGMTRREFEELYWKTRR
jgi:hypothetical protein